MTVQLNRRDFIAATGAAAVALQGPSWAAGFTVPQPVAAPCGGMAATVSCDYLLIDGALRPRAWRLFDGSAVELVQKDAFGNLVAVRDGWFEAENFGVADFATGHAQDAIRRRFGDDVVHQVVGEIERLTAV